MLDLAEVDTEEVYQEIQTREKENIIRECWLRGDLSYKLHAGQIEIEKRVRASKRQLFVGELARQFGKSFWLVKEALETAFKIKRGRIKYGTAFLTDLEEFILPAFEIICDDCPEDLRPVWKTHGSKFIIPSTRAEIKLVGLDRKPNGLRGNAIDLIILDEAGFMSRLDYIYKSVIIPATTHRPSCRILVFSTPPETPAHDFLDYVQKAEVEGGYLKLTIYDNPRVDETTIARLMEESGGAQTTTWRREYLCEHITDADLAIISDWDDKHWHTEERDKYYKFYHKYVDMDLGVSDNTAALFAYYDFKQAKYIIEDEFIINGPQMNTHILQAHLKHKEMTLWHPDYKFKLENEQKISDQEIEFIQNQWKMNPAKVYLRISDNNNPLLIQDLAMLHQIHFAATDKERLEEMVNAVKIEVRAGNVIVFPHCKQARGSLKYGIWDKHRKKFAQSKTYGHFDALAALVYGIRNLDKTTNPIPYDFGLDPDNQLLLPKKDSDSTKNLKRMFL